MTTRTLPHLAATALLALVVCGCRSTESIRLSAPPRPAPPEPTYDYTQEELKQIGEQERRERLGFARGAEPAQEESNRAPTGRLRPVGDEPAAAEAPPRRTRIVREVQVEEQCCDGYPHCYHVYGRYDYPHGYGYRRHSDCGPGWDGIGNMILYGTIGGIIGHQTGDRDEGILIGAGFGLLKDLFDCGW